jgi:hypothetical protein
LQLAQALTSGMKEEGNKTRPRRASEKHVSLVLGGIVPIEKISVCAYSDCIRESIAGVLEALYDDAGWIKGEQKVF